VKKVFFVSAKTGNGLDKLVEHLKYCYQLHKEQQKKIYVLGATNTGKSTFLNKLIEMQNKKHHQDLSKIAKSAKLEPTTLTTSAFPHTTMDFVKVRHVHLFFPLYDTPGVPSPLQPHLPCFATYARQLLITKQCAPLSNFPN
jgi:ribosome biogenesis GTPase A